MAEHEVEAVPEPSPMEKVRGKLDPEDSSSSDDDEKSSKSPAVAVQAKIYRLFGREKPVHQVLGGGKHADVFLWRDKKVSAALLGGATAIWVLFELMEYNLLTLVCHILIISLAIMFLWSNATTFIKKSPPDIPQVSVPEDLAKNIAVSLCYEINWSTAVLRNIALGRDLKKFLAIIVGLWVLSIIGNCCNFITLFYIAFVTLHTVPVLYEKYEDKVDAFAEKVEAQFKKHYAVVHAKYLSKIPKGPLKDKKLQ